ALLLQNTDAYQLANRPYADALGLSIIQTGNRNLAFDNGATRVLLLSTLAISVLLLLAPRLLRQWRYAATAAVAATAALVLAWNLAGQISAAKAANDYSKADIASFPRPLDWLDQATHGAPVPY